MCLTPADADNSPGYGRINAKSRQNQRRALRRARFGRLVHSDDLVERIARADTRLDDARGDHREEFGGIFAEGAASALCGNTEGRVRNRQPFLFSSSGSIAGAGPEAAP